VHEDSVAIHAHDKFKAKMKVTVCQTINGMAEWQGKYEANELKKDKAASRYIWERKKVDNTSIHTNQ
jgi:hypothetical protein